MIWRKERISHPTDYDTDFNRVLHVTSLDITGKRDKDAGWTICKYPCPDFFSSSRNRSVNGRGVFEAADAVECYWSQVCMSELLIKIGGLGKVQVGELPQLPRGWRTRNGERTAVDLTICESGKISLKRHLGWTYIPIFKVLQDVHNWPSCQWNVLS